jgi:hypothetical protein
MTTSWTARPVRALRTSNLRRALEAAAYEGKTLVARSTLVALPIARWRRHGVVIDGATDVLIEGYPRSANNFAVAAFLMAQPRPVRIAHHVHAPAHVIAAARTRIPALVLVRDPEDAVLEFVIRRPSLSIRQALRGYLRFYGPLLAHRDGFVVGSFDDVTSDFGAVIRRLNEQFGTGFAEFEHSPENVRSCFDDIERHYRTVTSEPDLERVVGRPSAVRDALKGELRPRYRDRTLSDLREPAERLFETFTSGA